jgi:membrane protease YdiL (CAAX protease family)
MTNFQLIALCIIILWLLLVTFRFRRSRIMLVVGLLLIGLYTLLSVFCGQVTFRNLGLGTPKSWLLTISFALAGLVVIVAYSPLADWLASRWFHKPPDLESFRVIQQSKVKLVGGILIAWVLGGTLEELIARGIVLKSIDSVLLTWLSSPLAAGIAVCASAIGAGIMHFYQGSRAMVIITQISILFGVLFVESGYNLWTVILCHGLYDTIAFVRFARKQSKYST